MTPKLTQAIAHLDKCRTPESLFGELSGTVNEQVAVVRLAYKRLTHDIHEDKYADAEDKAAARVAFNRLHELMANAIKRITNKTYGSTTVLATITTKKDVYSVTSALCGGDIATLYRATNKADKEVLLKIAASSAYKDLIHHEARTVKDLCEASVGTGFPAYLPSLLESTSITQKDVKAVNVFEWREGFTPLTNVVAEHPSLNPRHGVWIFNRLLSILGFVHLQGRIHGAILPTHALVSPRNHGMMLVGWSNSTLFGHRLHTISKGYKDWYPPEVQAKITVTPGTDIYMAAKCIEYLVPDCPAPLQRILDSCLLPNPARRPNDAWGLADKWGEAAEGVFGPKRFVELEMTV